MNWLRLEKHHGYSLKNKFLSAEGDKLKVPAKTSLCCRLLLLGEPTVKSSILLALHVQHGFVSSFCIWMQPYFTICSRYYCSSSSPSMFIFSGTVSKLVNYTLVGTCFFIGAHKSSLDFVTADLLWFTLQVLLFWRYV